MKSMIEIRSIIASAGLSKTQAVALTTAYSESELCKYIESNDSASLQAIHGIGPKSAQKLIDGLKGKLGYTNEDRTHADYEMYPIRRLTLNPNYLSTKANQTADKQQFVIDSISQRIGPLQQKMLQLSHGEADCMFKTVSTIPEYDPEEVKAAKQHVWSNAVLNGLNSKSGRHYIPYGHGTNAAKQNCMLWCDEKVYKDAMEYANCGASPEWKITPAKKTAYQVGLLSVFTKELPFDLQPENVMFFGSLEREHKDLVVNAAADGTVSEPAIGSFMQNEFDGLAVFHVSVKMYRQILSKMSDEEKKQFKQKMSRLKDFTFRAPYNKGLCVTSFDIHRYLHDHGIHQLNGKDIDDIILFADETVMKASIGNKEGTAFKTYEDYCEAFHNYGHRYGSLIEEHADTPHNLPYQQIQTAVGCDKNTILQGASQEADYINGFCMPEKAAALLGGELAQVAKICPEIMEEGWFNRRIQASYTKIRNGALGGTAHAITHYAFVCPDLIAFAQHIAGMKVVGCLEEHEAYIKNGVTGETVITRSPCLDPGSLCIMDFKDSVGCYDVYFSESTTVMISIVSSEATRCRADFDGDHLIYTRAEWYLKAVKESHAAYGNFLVNWIAPKAAKILVDRKAELEYFISLTQTNRLGQYCDALTKLYSISDVPDYREVSWLTYAANVLVDASKHGSEKFVVPEFVSALSQQKIPKFSGQAKDNKKPTAGQSYSEKASPEYGTGNGDMFANYVKEHTETTLQIIGLKQMKKFNAAQIMFNPKPGYRGLAGLTRYGKYDKVLGYAPDAGLFQNICLRTAAEWNSLKATEEGRTSQKEYEHWAREQAQSEIRKFAEDRGATLEDAYDVIVSWVFNYANTIPALEDTMHEGLRKIFGDFMVRAALQNAALPFISVCDEIPD